MRIFLDDRKCREHLYPFTHTRHVSDIRVGILTIREKWELLTSHGVITSASELREDDIHIHADIIPTLHNVDSILQAAADRIAMLENETIRVLRYPWQIFQFNDWAIRHDMSLLTKDRVSQSIPLSNRVENAPQIFLEEGCSVEHAVLNASAGPIYIGKNALVMEGSLIRGPFAMGEKAVLKMGTRIYGGTTIGPGCVAGGEIKNTVMFEFSNKAHDGYLGDSVIGAWCNLGAGTSNSNVKNNAGAVYYFLDTERTPIAAGNKAGLLMGDYSRCAINTSFNTGTVVGVSCNIFGESRPPKYVENFSWGSDRYIFEKALTDINAWKQMKMQQLSSEEKTVLRDLYSSNL